MKDGRPGLVFTTDVNGTTTPENTFAVLVAPLGHDGEMAALMADYTTGRAAFSDVLPKMRALAGGVDRARLDEVAAGLVFFPGAVETLSRITSSPALRAAAALSTTGFAGLMALLNTMRHGGGLFVAASPVLTELLTEAERSRLIRPILAENHKKLVIDDLAASNKPLPGLVFHVGDTLGDFEGIRHAAELGGLGIAFNPNAPLVARLRGLSRELRKNIHLIEFAPGETFDYSRVLDAINERLMEKARISL